MLHYNELFYIINEFYIINLKNSIPYYFINIYMKKLLFFGTKFNFFLNNLFQSTHLRIWKETNIFNSHSVKKRSDTKKGEEYDDGNGGGEEIGEEEKW